MTAVVRPSADAVRAAAPDPRQLSVAWPTVLALAVALVCADMFWVVSLREVVGAIERTAHPSAQWLRESLLLLPTYVVAVLGARAACQRHHRATPRARGRASAVTALLVVGLGTLVGVLALAASSAYDYRLQMALLEHTTHARCVGGLEDCLQPQRASTIALQLRSTAYGSALILATNAVVVGWFAALLGGRLSLDRVRDGRLAGAAGRALHTDGATAVAAAALAGAAAVHAAVVPEHLAEWAAAGVFFAVLAGAQAATAVAVLRRPGPSSWSVAVAVSAAPLVIWLWSRTMGIPSGPEAGVTEPVGLADVAAGCLQVVTLLCVALRARPRPPPPWAVGTDTIRIALVGVVAVTALGLGGSGIGWLDVTGDAPHGHSAEE